MDMPETPQRNYQSIADMAQDTGTVGTDVSEALEKLPGGKPAILVVMHHTFNPDQVLPESRRLVNNPNVKLTVDCLFHEDKLLKSNRNDTAWFDVQKYLGVSKVSTFPAMSNMSQKKFFVILAGNTNNAHLEFVEKLESIGHTEVNSPEESDCLLVFCPVASRVGTDISEASKELPVSQKKFFVILAGRTNDAHLEFVAKLKSIGHTEVNSPEESDCLLVFCPVASNIKTDVSEALEKLPGGKAAILVVMHHTFNPDQVLSESRKLVDNPNVKLTVDCLFYEDKLLKSNRNENAWIDVQKYVGVSTVSTFPAISNWFSFSKPFWFP